MQGNSFGKSSRPYIQQKRLIKRLKTSGHTGGISTPFTMPHLVMEIEEVGQALGLDKVYFMPGIFRRMSMEKDDPGCSPTGNVTVSDCG